MDKSNGKLLQSFKDSGFSNTQYRIRSSLGGKDAFAISGSEDGMIYAWDVVSGDCLQRLQHQEYPPGTKPSRKVVSAVACKRRGHEWASAGNDGESL